MALTITNHQIRSADTPRTAEPGDSGWTVTWLPGRRLTEGQAAVMESAGAASQVPADRHPGCTTKGPGPAWTPGPAGSAGYGVVAAAGPGGDEDEQA